MAASQRRLSALVVDDDPCVTQIVEAYLEQDFASRLEVVALNDSWRARDWLERRRCDLLISDIEMPGCDGLEMLRFAKQQNPWIPVVFMTAHSTWERIAQAVELGASDYLLKPISHLELFQVITHECARLERWRSAVVNTLHPTLQRY